MNNVQVTKKYASATVSALLLFGAVAAGMLGVPYNAVAQTAVNIQTSTETFYGPGFVRVLITDTAFDETGDTIFPTIEARDGSTVLDAVTPEIESIGSSGQFEFFITTSSDDGGTHLLPANPTKRVDNDGAGGFGAGPFVIRVNAAETTGQLDVDVANGVDVNSNPVALASNSYGLNVDMDAEDGDNFRILYGGQTTVVSFDDVTGSISLDRAEAGTDNEIVVRIMDFDANLDPTLIDTFDINAGFAATTDLLDSTNPLAFGNGLLRETGQNTGIFEFAAPITVDNTNDAVASAATNQVDAPLPIGNTFTLRDHSIFEVIPSAVAPFDAIDPVAGDPSDTTNASITLRNRDGAVALLQSPTLAGGLQVQITDQDRNIDAGDDDNIANAGNPAASATLTALRNDAGVTGVLVAADLDGVNGIEPNAATPEAVFFNFAETGDGTGTFLPDYNDDKIEIRLAANPSFDGGNGIINLTPAQVEDGLDLRLIYKDPAFQTNSVFEVVTEVETTLGQLSANMTTVGITGDAEITLTDPDLNTNPNTIQTYVLDATNPGVPPGGSTNFFQINGQNVAQLLIEANSNDVLALANSGVSVTFIETGPDTGVFVADDLDISVVDTAADGVAGGAGGNIDDGEEIEVTYEDILDDDDSDVTFTLGIPDSGIDVDRSTIPLPLTGAGNAVTIILSVIDPTQNTNSGSTEEVDVPFNDIVVRDGNGDTFTGAADGAIVTQLTGLPNGVDVTLRETGPNTGIFEEDIELQTTLATNAANADRLRDTRVTFEYDDDTISVTYRSFDGNISVSPGAVGPGGEVVVTVVDQDENKDPDERDEITVPFETDEDTELGGQSPLTLTETGPNTGTFTETVEIGVDIRVADVANGDFSSEITLTYNDVVTSSGDINEDREATIRIATSSGQILVTPEMVGPGTEVTVTIIDTDLNERANSLDDIPNDGTVEITSSEGTRGNLGFEETGPNSGIFEATVQFEPRAANQQGAITPAAGGDDVTYTALPGDIIAIRYEDETNAAGNSVLVSLTLQIVSQDPTMTTTEQTVQVGGTIELTVQDSDANRDGDSLDSIDVEVTSDSDPVGFTLAALETGDNTGNFTVNIPTSQSLTSGSITVTTGDNVYLEYNDEFPADYEDRSETVLDPSRDFVLIVPVGNRASDINATTPEAPMLQDISGNTLSEVTVGQQVILSADINNNNDFPQPFAGIVEVRNADGFTVYLQWQTGTLNPNGTTNIGLSFVPDAPGEYTTRVFVLSSIENPSILSPVEESTFTVS